MTEQLAGSTPFGLLLVGLLAMFLGYYLTHRTSHLRLPGFLAAGVAGLGVAVIVPATLAALAPSAWSLTLAAFCVALVMSVLVGGTFVGFRLAAASTQHDSGSSSDDA